MPLNLASPGISVREVDLTIGRVDPSSEKIGGLVAPFAQGPVGVPVIIGSEKDLLDNFGRPYGNDKHYEHWMVASSYLAYGAPMRIVRSDDTNITNAYVGSGSTIKIKSIEHYEQLQYDENVIPGRTIIAKNPGSWANGIRIGIIDSKADQILIGVATAGVSVGYGLTQSVVGKVNIGVGATSALDGHLKGIITEVGQERVSVKVLSHVSAAGTETVVDYQPSGTWYFDTDQDSGEVYITENNGGGSVGVRTVTSDVDWFDNQDLSVSTSTVGGTESTNTIKWNSVVDRPSTSGYVAERGGRFDEVHVVVIDGEGKITGNAGTILEKHLSLSKATDAEFSVGSPSYWRSYLKSASQFIYGGSEPSGIVTTGYSSDFNLQTDTGWDQNAEGIIFGGGGNNNLKLSAGKNYDGGTDITTSGALSADVNQLVTGYGIFENTENFSVDFLVMGSANYSKSQTQALANKLIAVADIRKDALAFISPYREAFLVDTDAGTVTVNNDDVITDNVLSFYAPLTSSTYGVFDSGYKYMYDRFSNTFRYIPLNGDIAGLCARNDIDNFPWFSPAGTARGAILNAVKLAYNPSQSQRDKLYSNRINPVILSPGAGIILFGDKTAFGRSSAFDRINVRRLFIYLEDAISAAARDQLFEFNDEITRTNFVNIVEPFLRDVQAKRGIQDYVVICDETNNTAAIIDNNEFVADIFIKPARSINFIGLTFVATRTGVSFEEVIGNV